jgi:TnpA family transposase
VHAWNKYPAPADQHTTYGTKVIVATKRARPTSCLMRSSGNATDVPVSEHATDTHGVTLVNFGRFDLLGMQLSPRIRDMGKITLYRRARERRWRSPFRTPDRCSPDA